MNPFITAADLFCLLAGFLLLLVQQPDPSVYSLSVQAPSMQQQVEASVQSELGRQQHRIVIQADGTCLLDDEVMSPGDCIARIEGGLVILEIDRQVAFAAPAELLHGLAGKALVHVVYQEPSLP